VKCFTHPRATAGFCRPRADDDLSKGISPRGLAVAKTLNERGIKTAAGKSWTPVQRPKPCLRSSYSRPKFGFQEDVENCPVVIPALFPFSWRIIPKAVGLGYFTGLFLFAAIDEPGLRRLARAPRPNSRLIFADAGFSFPTPNPQAQLRLAWRSGFCAWCALRDFAFRK
jgi:hypothetical protein